MASNAAVTINTGSSVDSSAIGNFDFAICLVCAWLVPRLVSHHRTFLRSLDRSPQWVAKHAPAEPSARDIQAARHGYAGGNPQLAAVNDVVNKAMLQAIGAQLLVLIGCATALGLLTEGLDYRTTYILKGISYFVGSFYFFLLSFSAPQWLAVYASVYDQRRIDLGDSLSSLATRARMSTGKTFLMIFPLIMPFFCGTRPGTVPWSIISGSLFGFFLCLVIDFGNRTFLSWKEIRAFALFLALVLITMSSVVFMLGCSYVEEVWGDKEHEDITTLDILSLAVCFVVQVLLHLLVWKISHDWRPVKMMGETSHQARHRHSSQVSEGKGGVLGSVTDSIILTPKANVTHRPHTFFGKSVRFSDVHLMKDWSQSHHDITDNDEETPHQDAFPSDELQEQPAIVPGPEVITEGEEGEEESSTILDKSDGTNKEDVNEIGMNGKGVNKDDYITDKECELEEEEEPQDPYCHIANLICCDLTCGAGGKEATFAAKAYNCCGWFLWFLLFAGSLFFILIMVGSMHQERIVRDTLPRVEQILYTTQNTAHMCAFNDNWGDDNTTRREKFEATQKTFDTPEEAILAGYTILHCGACAKCSNWNDLRLEYATRGILGQVALECAKKSLFGGGYQTLLDCTMEKTTFLEPCARCWATDYECTKKHCMWIGMRAFMINSVTNLAVGGDDITPATCEEAMCEATEITGYEGFVPCSGASRRRMNVTSTIVRPDSQQCKQVHVKWEEFFGPSEGELDYIPYWGETLNTSQPLSTANMTANL